MGQGISTPLSLTMSHWSEVADRASHLALLIKRRRWQAYCTSEWPTFEVGWPPSGTFHLDTVEAVKAIVFSSGPRGHPDQEPYISLWENLVKDPPAWVQPFLPPKLSVLTASPPAISALTPAPPQSDSCSVLPCKSSDLIPSAHAPTISPIYPPLPPILSESQSDLVLLDSSPPPPYPRNTPANAVNTQALAQPAGGQPAEGPTQGPGNRRAQSPEEVAVMLPLRPFGPPVPDGHGGEISGLQYWPFSSSDLYNWKNNNPPFSEDPVKLTRLLESLMFSHQPTWDDCQQLLNTLFTTEEKNQILLEARKLVPGPDGNPTPLPNLIEEGFPLGRPNWDPNTPAGRQRLILYRQTLMAGLRAAARRPTNLAKVRQVVQGPEESPSGFLERLMEAYRRYTPFDPESEEQRGSLAMAFIGQSATDIRRKLQRMDGLQDMALRDLVKEAEKVFYKRETIEEREQRLEKERVERKKKKNKKKEKGRETSEGTAS